MITLRPGKERGHANHGWLDTFHTFSFNTYYDEKHMGFRSLRVINEDRVAGGGGFPTHPHRDMEIVTYVLEGALEHRDSLGTGSVIRPGEIQRMSAGTGIRHSEFNQSKSDPVHLLQIWITPEKNGLKPEYEQKKVPAAWSLIASPEGGENAVTIHQDARIWAGRIDSGVTHELAPGRHAWVQVTRGSIELNGKKLAAGDGAAVSDEAKLELKASEPAEVLLFDLA